MELIGGSFSAAWEVFLLFFIPIGGGVPAGVLLARKHGIEWPGMLILYFFSDVGLAFLFEPFLVVMRRAGEKFPHIAKLNDAFKKSTALIIDKYGKNPGPFALIMLAFGVDPMTGRTAALAAGHGFITGWILAIMGDMIFFSLIMVSTLWLGNILGDGTWTAVIIMVAMIGVPFLIRKVRERFSSSPKIN